MREEIKLFILANCPYCKDALGFINELKAENPMFCDIELTVIDEQEEAEIAAQYDYYYVPTFYLGNIKLHEGAITKVKVAAIFERFLSG